VAWPAEPTATYTDPDRAAARRAFEAMMIMRKIDVAEIEKAWRGRP
jgi:predicted 3-demethylubiquinone-9 3-methyltransferase (glyoxalase superfamily)